METRSRVVSMRRRAEPKFESVTMPASLPARWTAAAPASRTACAIVLAESRSPNESR